MAAPSCRGSNVDLRVPQRGDKRALMETVARNAEQALALHKTRRGSDLTTRSLALAGDPGGARPRRGAAAHRVLRRLAPPGHRRRRLDGRVRGRPGPQERVPAVRHHAASAGPDDVAVDPRGDHPAVPALPRGAGRRPASSTRDEPATTRQPTCRVGHRPRDRPAAAVRLPAEPRRRRRRRTAGRGRPAGARRARHRRRRAVRARQAARGGLAARATPHPVVLPRTSEGLYLLQRVRDEAHRFAITYHRNARSQVDDGAAPSTACPGSARPGARRCSSTSARSSGCAAAVGRRDRRGARHRPAHGRGGRGRARPRPAGRAWR